MQNDAEDNVEAGYTAFIYDEKRWCPRVSLFIKTIGLAFYTTSISTCNFKTMDLRISITLACMLLSTIASICNSLQYEYALYLKYDTVFESYEELRAWKTSLRPNLAMVFSGIELAIKLVFLNFSLPLEISFYEHDPNASNSNSNSNSTTASSCEAGKSVLKIHILVLLVTYAVALIFTAFIFVTLLPVSGQRRQRQEQGQGQNQGQSNGVQMRQQQQQLQLMMLQGPGFEYGMVYPQIECCICLDKTDQPWITMPCTHSFHYACISEWAARSPSCPVCRFRHPLN